MKRSRRRRRTGGFTLIEMLVVVAIIAVLVAVSVPTVNSSLEKAREAADAANERAAMAAALTDYLMEERTGPITYFYKSDGTVALEKDLEHLGGMPAGTPGYDYGQSKDNRNGCVMVSVTETDGDIQVTTGWDPVKSGF